MKILNKIIIPIFVGVGMLVSTGIRPDGVSISAWYMLVIFVTTIVACVMQTFPIGEVALFGFIASVLSGVISLDEAVAGFGNPSIWLIVAAFFMSRGFIKTGLGKRIALSFVKSVGNRTILLAYSLVGVDLLLAPATPSSSARAGGIVYPIVSSLCTTFHSSPEKGTAKKIGSYLVFVAFHANLVTGAMFLTAMAGNLLVQEFAFKQGIKITWLNWFEAASVPGIISLLCIPIIIYIMYPPTIKRTPFAKKWAQKKLGEMGAVTMKEKKMILVFIGSVFLWMTGQYTGISATLGAFISLSLLLLFNILNWDDVLAEKGAWNTLFWFSVLVMMAHQLDKLGFIPWLNTKISANLGDIRWELALLLVCVIFFYSHYLFASAVAHTSAMYTGLLALVIACGAPPLFSALILGFIGNLFSSTTHYATGAASIFYGSGYVLLKDWWRLNVIMGGIYLIIWIGVGSMWMKFIGVF